MSDDRDVRPLGVIPFAQDPKLSHEERESRAQRVYDLLVEAHCGTPQDVIDQGCTGISRNLELHEARFVRENMTGAGFGLPCYVPNTRFCLVHDTIGGLQEGQTQAYPERANGISRELTDDERKRVGAVAAHQEAERAAAAHELGATPTDDSFDSEDPLLESVLREAAGRAAPPKLQLNAVCPEHPRDKPEYRCRFCLAALIINGPFEPALHLQTVDAHGSRAHCDGAASLVLQEFNGQFGSGDVAAFSLFVRVARWERKLVPAND